MTKRAFHTFRLILAGLAVSGTCLTVSAQKSKPLSEDQQIRLEATFINGTKEKMLQNYDEAIRQFLSCVNIDPGNAAAHYMLGGLYLERKMYDDALLFSEKAVKLDSKNNWYKRQLGDVLKALNRHNEAAALYAEVGEKEEDAGPLLEAVYLYLMAKNYDKALDILEKIEKKAGVSEEIIRQKEQIYLAQNKLPKAIQEVEKLIKAYPGESRYKGMLADLYMANGKSEKALEIYREILKTDPGNGYASFALADYYQAKGDKQTYFSYLKAGISSSNVDVKTKLTMIVAFISAKDIENHRDRCFELAQAFVGSDPNESTAYMLLGDLYARQDKNYTLARNEYLRALALEPGSYPAWQQLVYCDSELRNNKWLQEDCTKALEYFPNEPLFHVYLTLASMQLKEYEKAVESARKGLDAAAGQPDVQVQLYSNIGDASHFLKNYGASDSAYEEALRIDPRNTYALNNYAYFLSLRKQRLDRAEEMSRKTIEAEPTNASYLDTYGWILYQRKEYEKAREYIGKSLELSPDNAEVMEHLGDVLYRLNQKDQALAMWKKAKALGSETEFINRKVAEGKLYE